MKWVVREKGLFNVEIGKVKILTFLCMNYINRYNNEIGGNGITDNLSNYYRISDRVLDSYEEQEF